MKQKPNTALSVLGLLAYHPAYMAEIADTLRPEMFGASSLTALASEVWQAYERRKPLNPSDLRDLAPELAEKALARPLAPARLGEAAERLKTAWEAAQLSDIYAEAQRIAEKGDPIAARQHVDGQTELLMSATARPDDKIAQIQASLAHMERYFQTGEGRRVTGVDTGFAYLNKETHGWQRGDVNIIAGVPGKGKTTVSIQSALAAAKLGHHALYFSCGDSTAEQLYLKAACILAGIDVGRVMGNTVTVKEKGDLGRAYEELTDLPFRVIDRKDFSGNSGSIRDISRRMALTWEKEGLIVIDYIQQLRANWVIRDPVERTTQVSADVKEIAVMLDCPVIAVSQLSRDFSKQEGRRPRNSDLRGSGALEQDASRILFVDKVSGEDCLYFTKCRHGALKGGVPFAVGMDWRADIGRYAWIFDTAGTFPISAPAPFTSPAMEAARPVGDDDVYF